MELATKIAPSKHLHNHNHQSLSPHSENQNPNFFPSNNTSSSLKKHSKSPKPAPINNNKSSNSNINSTVVIGSPQSRIRQRKFLVAKKNNNCKNDAIGSKTATCKCTHKDKGETFKCLCVAYENLRALQNGFFENREVKNNACDEEEEAENAFIEASLLVQDLRIDDANEEERGKIDDDDDEGDSSACLKRRRNKLLEDARNSVPESGSGRVMHLVKAFEKLLSMPKSKKKEQSEEQEEEEEEEGNEKNKSRVMKWALPGLQFEQPQSPNVPETEVSGSSSSSLICASENLALDSRISVSSSCDKSRHGSSVSSRNSSVGRRSRRNSSESCSTFGGGRRWKQKKQLKFTSQKPFKLRTEQRGKLKEEEFMKKVQEMVTEEQKMRVPIAQCLPWTTNEPECLVKPPVKESTRPIDFKLHSDVRAIDRAEFDQQVAEKMSLIEQLKLERERQQKLAEEEAIRRLRKELIPKAQPMSSMKHPTIPREPKFHIPQHKKIKCCLSWNNMKPYSSYLN